MLKTLKIVCIYNPFESVLSREEREIALPENKSISSLIEEYFPEVYDRINICACYNGAYINHDYIIKDPGILTFTVIPGSDTQTMRQIAGVVIMIAAVATGQLYGTELGAAMFSGAVASGAMTAGTATAIGTGLIVGTISVGGTMLLNSILPLDVPKEQKAGSRNYSFSGSSNHANDGDVLPDLIGTVRFSPPLIGAYRSIDGDTSSTQYINLLYALGDISDGVRIILSDGVTGSLIEKGPKIFINNADQSQVTVNSVVSSLEYDPLKTLVDYEKDKLTSINTYFNNTVHEVEIGKGIPLDRHLDATNSIKSVQVTKNLTHNGYAYASIPSGTEIGAPQTVNTTVAGIVSEIGIKFSFVRDTAIIDRVDKVNKEINIYTYEYGEMVDTGLKKQVQVDILKYAWMCKFKYKLNGTTEWASRDFAIFGPQWNGTNDIDGGLWYEHSNLIHPTEEIGEESNETPSVYGDQFSFSIKLPSNGKWDYGIDCTSLKMFMDGGGSKVVPYMNGVVTGDNFDFCCIDGFTESTPDAMESFDIDGNFDINEITTVLYFPAGLISYNSKTGNSQRQNVKISLGIRRGDDGNWIEKIVDLSRQTKTPFRHAVHFPVELFENAGSIAEHYYIRAYYIGDYTNKNIIASCTIDYVQLSKMEPMIYPGVATLAMRIKASQKVSGRPPVIEVIARRDDYPIKYDGSVTLKKSCNPAWACVFRLQKFGVKEQHIQWSRFEEWAQFCDDNHFECNHYIDTEMSLSETLEFIARCGRGAIVRRGVYYDVLIDKPSTPVQMFTDGNIIAGSFSQNFIADEDLANVVCVWYSEVNVQSGQSKKRAIEVRANNITGSDEIKKIEVEFMGCSNKELAKKYAIHLLNQTIAVRKTIEFVASIDAVTCQVGDVVMISMNTTNWTVASGRTEIVTNSFFEIDQPIVFDSAYSQYRIRVRKNNNGNSQVDTIIELPVTPVVPTNPLEPLIRFSTSLGLNELNSTEIEDNCFIYSLGAIRSSDSVYLDSKKFRIVTIEREGNNLFRIRASEYFPEMYNDEYIINEIETPTIQRNYINNLKGVANFSYDGKPYITLTWTGKSPVFYVFYKSEGSWIKFGESIDTICNLRGINFTPAETYMFSVSVSDNPYAGNTCEVLIPEDHVPLKPGEKDVLSEADYLAITGLEIVGQGNDTIWKEKDLKIRWNEIVYDFDAKLDKPVEGAATTNSDMKELRKFRVCIRDRCGTLLKEVIVYEPHFELTFDDNKKLFSERIIDPYTGCAMSGPPIDEPPAS